METPLSLNVMFQDVGLSYGWSMPVLLLFLLAILSLATIRGEGRVSERVSALYCHLMQFIGVLLMSAGALPALHAVFSQQLLSQMTYMGLLLVFAVGGILFLWHDARLQEIDVPVREAADALFLHTWKLMGVLVVVFTGLSLLLHIMLADASEDAWRVTHLVMLLYGFILCWFTLHRSSSARSGLRPASRPAPRILIARKAKKRT